MVIKKRKKKNPQNDMENIRYAHLRNKIDRTSQLGQSVAISVTVK